MQQYFISTLIGDAATHNPRRSCLEEVTYQFLKIFNVFFRSFPSILFLFPLVTFRKNQSHWNLIYQKKKRSYESGRMKVITEIKIQLGKKGTKA